MGKITAKELKNKYFEFFKNKGHKVIPSAPLVPENDPSALFISAGMHPLAPYLLGESHPLGKRLVDIQECVRTADIEEVGDGFHHTWFEMLGNWALGDYWKTGSIALSFGFLTKVLKIDPGVIFVSCFKGDKDAPKDEESAKAWKSLGIPKEKIFFYDKKENWWGPVGNTGPCGPDSEIFIDTGKEKCSSGCNPSCSCGKYIEIWNNVFMEYEKKENGQYLPLKQKNVDTGMGIERMVAILNGLGEDDYQTSIFWPIIKKIESISGKKYDESEEATLAMRIIADHFRSAVFIIADGVEPGNKEQPYVLRRLIRRAVRQGERLGLKSGFAKEISLSALDNQENYGGEYPELNRNKERILSVITKEEESFRQTLNRGLKEFLELVKKRNLTGLTGFDLYQTLGFPLEMIIEEANRIDYKLPSNFKSQFREAKKSHQKLSRTAAKGKFKGGLAGQSKAVVKYHTATHLLHWALREVLGKGVSQAGSNITTERLRFDFTHGQALSGKELRKVEQLVNDKIEKDLEVKMEIMSLSKALKTGALTVPEVSYPAQVKVYSIGNYSREVCGGPHVRKTGKLGQFKIIKQEALGQGKRRVYAVLEN